MPAAVVHYLHAKKVLEEIKYENSIQLYEKAYYYGAQGPDIFFTHRLLPWMRGQSLSNFGTMIHQTDPVTVLEGIKKYVLENHTEESVSYFLGFICHYSLDSVTHPFINAMAKILLDLEPKQDLSVMHSEVEAALESIVYGDKTGALATELNIGSFFPKDEVTIDLVSDLYPYLINRLSGESVDKKTMIQICEDANKVRSKLTDKTGIKRSVISFMEAGRKRKLSAHFIPIKEDDFDWSNSEHSVWVDADGNESDLSFFDLFDEAVEKAVGIISGIGSAHIKDLVDNVPFG